jgi:5-methyltetrahydrofolate--homocysteine methyltransferase
VTLAEALSAGVVVADGAMGTLGFSRGLSGPPTMWTVDRPDEVEAMHRAYVDAGARLVATNTFGASRAWLPASADVAAVNRAAVEVARRAAAGRAVVAGDVGPAGGDYREQVAALVGAGADAILVETMDSLDELRAAVVAANEVRGRIPVVASMTFERGARTRTGATARDLAALADELGVEAVGANCSEGPDSILPVVEALARLSDRPVLAKPSAGLPDVSGGRAPVYRLGPAEMSEAARRLVDAGARIVGGCCGTTPETIRAIAFAVGSP